jgi:hypothetical protein
MVFAGETDSFDGANWHPEQHVGAVPSYEREEAENLREDEQIIAAEVRAEIEAEEWS